MSVGDQFDDSDVGRKSLLCYVGHSHAGKGIFSLAASSLIAQPQPQSLRCYAFSLPQPQSLRCQNVSSGITSPTYASSSFIPLTIFAGLHLVSPDHEASRPLAATRVRLGLVSAARPPVAASHLRCRRQNTIGDLGQVVLRRQQLLDSRHGSSYAAAYVQSAPADIDVGKRARATPN